MIEASFNATCVIQRRVLTGSKDEYGHDAGKYSYSNVATGVRCRREGWTVEETGTLSLEVRRKLRESVVATDRIFFSAGQDVVATDQIVESGETLEVLSVNPRPGGRVDSHVEVVTEVVR